MFNVGYELPNSIILELRKGERERERKREGCMCVYIYMHISIYTYTREGPKSFCCPPPSQGRSRFPVPCLQDLGSSGHAVKQLKKGVTILKKPYYFLVRELKVTILKKPYYFLVWELKITIFKKPYYFLVWEFKITILKKPYYPPSSMVWSSLLENGNAPGWMGRTRI